MKKFIAAALIAAVLFSVFFYQLTKRLEETETFVPQAYSGHTLVIDAGHGGEDGGAVSVSGVSESRINLAIARRLELIMGLYGVDTVLLRTEDISLHSEGASTLREKKISDLHNRVDRVNSIDNAVLISIHQNSYSDSQYRGAQVFFAPTDGSQAFGEYVQEVLRVSLNPDNTRLAKQIPDTVYLMNHITCRAILVECGFLSNPEEDQLLQTPGYQLKLASALAGAYLQYERIDS